MNKYVEMKERHQKEVSAFPMQFAFSNKQFEEGMKALGLEPYETDKIYRLGETGGFYRRTDADSLNELFNRHDAERTKAIEEDTDGTGYIKDMFYYELGNHEYCITMDVEDTFTALGLSADEVMSSPAMKAGFKAARKQYIEDCM